MVIEHLVVVVSPEDRAGYLAADAQHWTAFLAAQDGFVRKETWVDEAIPHELHLMIWWETRDQWKAITAEQCAEVDARMGPYYRDVEMREYTALNVHSGSDHQR